MMDIARHLNISQATVSYVLSGRASGSISEHTRSRVMEAAQEMGYRRNRAAQALAGHGSHIIEFCVTAFFPSYYAQVLEAFNLEIRPTPYELHIVNPAFSSEEEWAISKGDWPVDGVIADVPLPETMLSWLRQRGTPIVSVGLFAHTEIDHVFVDMTSSLLEGLRQLAAHSRRVAFVSMWAAHPVIVGYRQDSRYPVYRQVMQEAGLAEEVIVVHQREGISLRALTREVLRNYIEQNGCPDAFFCFNDERAIGTLAALRDLGVRVPQDVRLLGCDGIEDAAYHYPAISTIQYPFAEVARLSWEFLQHRMKHPDAPLQSATLAAQLVLRESSASRN
ncbi:catabolite control protein A [Abditibacteriota bacterium]|nr:catabolite control protein A [Abditibacteriota bacterium]